MRKSINKVFGTLFPYREDVNNLHFLKSIKKTSIYFYNNLPYYKDICRFCNFHPKSLNEFDDLHKLPVIPTLFLKRNNISIKNKSVITVTSSGTSNKKSVVSYTLKELLLMAQMAINMGRVHKLFSIIPTRYILLGYQPSRHNQAVISKTAYMSTWYAPGISRTYALRYQNGDYRLNLNLVLKNLLKHSRGKFPVRIIGFPSYTYFLLKKMKARNISCKLPKGSKILLGGGWKQFASDEISKDRLYQLVYEVLGINKNNIHEFFGAAEHPIIYTTCRNHRFHVNAYGKVIIRDVLTHKPLEKEQVGLLNLLTPIGSNLPIMSVLTDDLAVIYDGLKCGCGISTDYFEILGRVGVTDIKTCAGGAKDYWRDN